jgi:hypothetical protein
LSPLGGGGPSPLADSRIKVGFLHRYVEGTKPCNCWAYAAESFRGTILFKTVDIPHHFKAATLVLKAESASVSDPSMTVPFIGIFETSWELPSWFGGDATQFEPGSGRITVLQGTDALFPERPVTELKPVPGAFGFPPPPYPSGAVIEEPGPFSYRINVTSTVTAWVADWLKRNETPLRGFILVGTDESLPHDSNTSLQITYLVTLEFDIDEPDL